MSERIARLRAHHRNVERYEGLLKTKLAEIELQYLQKRLAEERFAIAMLQFMGRTPTEFKKCDGVAPGDRA